MNQYPEYESQIRRGDFGPDIGHYHVFVEQDGFMVPFTGWWSALGDQLCWATRDGAWWSVGKFKGAATQLARHTRGTTAKATTIRWNPTD